MKPTILIVDDEPLARAGLRRLVEAAGRCAVVGECADGRDALATIARARPDVVLLDIEMPELDAFDVLRRIDEGTGPCVVLVTAYEEHGLAAFDAGAVDYVLKPVDPGRLDRAIERALRRRTAPESAGSTRTLQVTLGGRSRFVPVDEILWVEAAGSYVRLHVPGDAILHRASLGRIEAELASEQFVRVHRSALVALRCIRTMEPAGHGDATLVLTSGDRVPVSRRYREALSDRLG